VPGQRRNFPLSAALSIVAIPSHVTTFKRLAKRGFVPLFVSREEVDETAA